MGIEEQEEDGKEVVLEEDGMEVVVGEGGKEASGDGGLEGGKVHSRQDMEVGMAFGTHYFLQGQTDDLERPLQHLVCIYFAKVK